MTNKLLIILGPTASGKTTLAVKLARRFKGEIISADSRQVYRGMDIGTGKDLKEYKKIPHHLIDIISPKKQLTLADWQALALQKIKEIQKKSKLPILCGGTGLYISSIIEGYQLPKIKSASRRTNLDKLTLNQLLNKLKKIDLVTYKIIDKKNRRRVQRSLEIYYQTGLPKSAQLKKQKPAWDILQIGLKMPREELYQKIDKRLKSWLEKEDLIGEVKKLRKQGIFWQRLEDFGLEYRWVAKYLQKKIDYQTMFEQSKNDLHHYAKQQMTWFKRDKKIKWINDYGSAEKFLSQFLFQ
ncbi:MAG: tRNA (adenosine(37)-N6)-dimethylallyltransferase MiaA [bacterium]